MTTEPADQQPEDDDLKKRLLKRVAVAAILILCLLGGLAVFDNLVMLNTPPKKQAKVEPPAAPPPLPVTPPKEDEKVALAANEEVVPETTESPNGEVLRGASTRERPLTVPATASNAMLKPSGGASSSAPNRESARDVAKEVARVIPAPGAQRAPASRPLTEAAESHRRFVVQMGVFSNVANAEELRAKLELNGIPAQIEARVQLGPFTSRQAAENAQKKLAALGLNTGMLVSSKK